MKNHLFQIENWKQITGEKRKNVNVEMFLFCFENFNKVMKWWNEREQKDKTKIIEKFKTLSNEQFEVWLLNEHKWKNEITKDDIDSICFSIDSYLALITMNHDSNEEKK
ncbi:hypothetical protein RFI_00909, partial [Reticulomyxa filosa]